MSLPAGAFITSLGGKRCTAIPRSTAASKASPQNSVAPAASLDPTPTSTSSLLTSSSTAAGPAAAVIVAASPAASSTSAALVESVASNSEVAVAAALNPKSTQSISTPVEVLTSTTSTSPAASPETSQATTAASASLVESIPSTSQTIQSIFTTTTSPTSPSIETLSTASSVLLQSDLSISTTSLSLTSSSITMESSTLILPSPTKAAGEYPAGPSAATVAATSRPSSNSVNIGATVGGIVGGLAFIGAIIFLFWLFRKKKRSHDSLLTPLNTQFDSRTRGEKYEIDGDSLGPTPRGQRWRAQAEGICSRIRRNLTDFEASLTTRFRISDAPSVNMNRGNSQFLEPISQHSRSSSAVSGGQTSVLATKDRLGDWWDRFIEDINFNWRLRNKEREPTSALAAIGNTAQIMAPSSEVGRDFSEYLAVKDNELRQGSDKHRRSRSTTTPANGGMLDLNFNGTRSPFTVRFSVQPTIPDLSKPPATLTLNPFADPKDPILPSNNKTNMSDYASNVRRSRGFSQSTPTTVTSTQQNPPNDTVSPLPGPRYPSSIRTSQTSYRDTISSSVSMSGRQVKGRSDPFDLERPDLWQPPPVPSQGQAEARKNSATSTKSTRNASPGPTRSRVDSVSAGKPRIVSQADTYTSSKYSSGMSVILSEWGDPGPDLGAINWRSVSPIEGSVRLSEVTTGNLSPRTVESVGRAL